MDPITQQTNYYGLVSQLIDAAGGRAFITECVAPASTVLASIPFISAADATEATAYVRDLLTTHPYVTRLFARLSAEDMIVDPIFRATPGPDVSRSHDLSNRPAVDVCAASEEVPCGSTYCGKGSTCASSSDGLDLCVCKTGTSGRAITAPDLLRGPGPSITCQSSAFDLLSSAGDSGACDGYDCGNGGDCLAIAGFPTCRCEDGFGASVNAQGRVQCLTVAEVFDGDTLGWKRFGSCAGCSAAGGATGWTLAALVWGWLSFYRRRIRS